jgi:aerobic-type carbon monoxide dehydrogenase small subunit (CoxS/CutS family)
VTIRLKVNGVAHESSADPMTALVDVLREEVGDLTPKPGCREGRCGACTVLVDGAPALSCLLPVGRAADTEVSTVELLGAVDADPVQSAFTDLGAVQCGVCTPGMVLAAHALLAEEPRPSREQIREALVNNLCRCTGYTKIVDAVEAAAARRGDA